METTTKLETTVKHAIASHNTYATKPSKAVRKWDGRTPYWVHPIWAATTLAHETTLPEELRQAGCEALALHDILEDTTAGFLVGTSDRVMALVEGMTFASSKEEMLKVWTRSAEVRLLKLYDKVSNLMDGAWMSPEKRADYAAYTLRLADEAEKTWGALLIVKIARALV